MNPSVSRLHWAALVASALLFAGLVVARHFAPSFPPGGDRELARLEAERRELAGNDDAVRASLQVQLRSRPVCDSAALDDLRAALGPAWRWNEGANSAGFRTATLAATPARWPAFLSALGLLEQQPGISVREVEFTNPSQRSDGRPAHARIEIAWLP